MLKMAGLTWVAYLARGSVLDENWPVKNWPVILPLYRGKSEKQLP